MTDIASIAAAARAEIIAAGTAAELDAARVRHLGRNAELVQLLRTVSDLPAEERARVGRDGNIARKDLEALVDSRLAALEAAELDARLASERTDITAPGFALPQGSLHLLTQTRRRIEDIFLGMGYSIVDGPEVESEFYNFTALNTPEGHPARSESDTYYIEEDLILRTQTSPVQVRTMQQHSPPLYVISPGRVYRRDEIDATHSNMFHQIEGLAIDEGLTMADLKGTLQTFCSTLFGGNLEVRLRAHFFPFTEPSVEVDVSCYRCGGSGDPEEGDDYAWCRLCRGVGWIEIMGAGMVDPNVLAHVPGYDAPGVSGFAFGMGVERIAMLTNAVPDLRLLFDNDARFLAQFPGR